MRLRYLHLRNYPPLEDVELSFSKPELPGRECAIRFVVGVNGSGKTHLLQALAEIFLALANDPPRPPHFPAALAYELGEGDRNRILLFESRGARGEAGWWQSTKSTAAMDADRFGKDEWRTALIRAKDDLENWEPLIKDGNWPGAGVGLPRTVLAYTTGGLDPWQALFHREPEAGDIDIVSQGEDYDTTIERPAHWGLQQELDFLARQASEESDAQRAGLLKRSDEGGTREHGQALCELLDPVLLKFAVLAVSLDQALADFREYETDEAARAFMQKIRDTPDAGGGLRRLLSQVGWVWPVSVALQVDFNPDDWGEREAMQKRSLLQALYLLANEVVREPDPSTQRRLFFDLKAKSDFDPAPVLNEGAITEGIDDVSTFEYQGDSLLQFLGGSKSPPFDRFKKLLELRRQGLLTDIQIAVRKADVADILLFDELSDGEQVYLGRMAVFHLLKGESDALLLLDEPEVHFNDKWKREIVDIIDEALKSRANDVLIATHSSITLTDVFNDEIILFEKSDGQAVPIDIRSTTFGADPSEVMIRLFGVPDSMGARALDWLDGQLDREWTANEMAELEKLLECVGPGFHRSEFRGILRRLKENAAQD